MIPEPLRTPIEAVMLGIIAYCCWMLTASVISAFFDSFKEDK